MMEIHKNLVVVGDSDCGKTSLISALGKKSFKKKYTPGVIGDRFFNLTVEGIGAATVRLRDTQGGHYDKLRGKNYEDADVVLICYSIDNPASLDNITGYWISDVRYFCPTAPIVLVGNKKDLRTDIATVHELANWKLKPVQAEAGLALSEKIDAYAYCECSVKLEEGIVEVIETAVRAALSTKKKGCCIMI